jgi:hypothetical protein
MCKFGVVFVSRPDQKSTAGMDPEEVVRKCVTGVTLPVDGGVTAA